MQLNKKLRITAELAVVAAFVFLMPVGLAKVSCRAYLTWGMDNLLMFCGHGIMLSYVGFWFVCLFIAIAWLLHRFGRSGAEGSTLR